MKGYRTMEGYRLYKPKQRMNNDQIDTTLERAYFLTCHKTKNARGEAAATIRVRYKTSTSHTSTFYTDATPSLDPSVAQSRRFKSRVVKITHVVVLSPAATPV
jgi:hypothetical protein